MKYEIKHRYTGAVLFTAELGAEYDNESESIRLGAAVKIAVKAKANLSYSNLSYSNLRGSNLSGSNLSYSDLSGSDLLGSDLSYSNLRGSDLRDAKNAEVAIARTRILPQGSIIGWKKCRGGVIVKLRIPEEAQRSHAFGRKCRAEYADVLEVIGNTEGVSEHDRRTVYKVGERVTCDKWESDWQQECAGGIHFYITREEAEAHV